MDRTEGKDCMGKLLAISATNSAIWPAFLGRIVNGLVFSLLPLLPPTCLAPKAVLEEEGDFLTALIVHFSPDAFPDYFTRLAVIEFS